MGYVIDIDSDLDTDIYGRPLEDEDVVYTDGTKLSDLVRGDQLQNLVDAHGAVPLPDNDAGSPSRAKPAP